MGVLFSWIWGVSDGGAEEDMTDVEIMPGTEEACFGAGCYWGTQKYFEKDFAAKFPGVLVAKTGKVGFMGPENAPSNPSYKQVCSGSTGHVEVYAVRFRPEAADGDAYRELVKFFFQFHDPTTLNRQGNDKGTQYASVIFCYTDKQRRIAEDVRAELKTNLTQNKIKFEKNREYASIVVSNDIRMVSTLPPCIYTLKYFLRSIFFHSQPSPLTFHVPNAIPSPLCHSLQRFTRLTPSTRSIL